MPTKVKAELRGQTFEGTVTSADVIALQSLFMNQEEIQIFRNPDSPDPFSAAEMMKQRQKETLERLTKELDSEQAADQQISQSWLQKLIVTVECDRGVRNEVLTRLMEIYPSIPDTWIYWNPRRELASHRLEPDELLFGLIMPALGRYAEENELADEPETEQPDPEDKGEVDNPEPDFAAAAKSTKPKAKGFATSQPTPQPAAQPTEDNAILALTSRLSGMPPAERQAQIQEIQRQLKEVQSQSSLLAEVSE